MGRAARVGCLLVLALAGCGGSPERDPGYALMQMNLCLSGLAGCYGKTAYPAVVDEATTRIRQARPDAVTLNEACQGDVALIARRTGYHARFSKVPYRGKLLQCVRPGGRGLFGDAVLTKAPIERTSDEDFKAQAGLEQRRWLCVTTARDIDVCTAHLNTRAANEVAGNEAAVRRAQGGPRPPRGRPARGLRGRRQPPPLVRPARRLDPHRPRRAPGPGASSTSTGAASSAHPRRRCCRPSTPTTTSCWSAPASRADRGLGA